MRRKRRKKPGGPDAPAIQTRQEFYYEVYRKILNDEILRGVYLPSRTRSGAADLLCGENLYEPGTYRYRVYARKRESASRMTVETLKYGYADNAVPRQRWIWRAPENSVALWSGLLSDFAEVDEKNREAVAFLCDAGLARIQEDTSAYLLRLGPNEPVTAEEAEALAAAVDSYVRAIPETRCGHAIRKETTFCFVFPILSLCLLFAALSPGCTGAEKSIAPLYIMTRREPFCLCGSAPRREAWFRFRWILHSAPYARFRMPEILRSSGKGLKLQRQSFRKISARSFLPT